MFKRAKRIHEVPDKFAQIGHERQGRFYCFF